jgi:hypothetical protein
MSWIVSWFHMSWIIHLMNVFGLFRLKWIFWCSKCENRKWIKWENLEVFFKAWEGGGGFLVLIDLSLIISNNQMYPTILISNNGTLQFSLQHIKHALTNFQGVNAMPDITLAWFCSKVGSMSLKKLIKFWDKTIELYLKLPSLWALSHPISTSNERYPKVRKIWKKKKKINIGMKG